MIAIAGGAIVALIVRLAKQPGGKELKVENMYDDSGEKLPNSLATYSYCFTCKSSVEVLEGGLWTGYLTA